MHPLVPTPAPACLLEARDLGFRHGDRWTLRHLSLSLGPGEVLGIEGRSGSGKSTLLRLLLGLVEPDEGGVHLAGRPWSRVPERQRRRHRPMIQAVFQNLESSLAPHLTGWQLLDQPLRIHGRGTPSERREAAARMAERVAFPEPCLHQRPAAWSRGLAQRFALGRALLLEPRVLLLDEPLSALDATLAQHLQALLLEMKSEGLAMVLVCHQPTVLARVCDRVVRLEAGHLTHANIDSENLWHGSRGQRHPKG